MPVRGSFVSIDLRRPGAAGRTSTRSRHPRVLWRSISPASDQLTGMERLAAETPRQIANANTMFNVLNTLLFIGFTGVFAKLAERMVPERETPAGVIIEPEFLDEAALAAPSVAMQNVRLELGRVGDITLRMLHDIRPAFQDRDKDKLADIARRDDEVEAIEGARLLEEVDGSVVLAGVDVAHGDPESLEERGAIAFR